MGQFLDSAALAAVPTASNDAKKSASSTVPTVLSTLTSGGTSTRVLPVLFNSSGMNQY